MKTVIGISGQKRAGKSTLAEYIKKACAVRGWTTRQVSFADPIKFMLREVFIKEVPFSTFTDDSRKKDKVLIAPGTYMTVREILQKVGTDCFRDVIHKDFWVYRGLAQIKGASEDIIIVPDVRFANELVALKNLGTTVFVERAGYEREIDLHPSETELLELKSEFDYTLVSENGDLERLKEWADEFVLRL